MGSPRVVYYALGGGHGHALRGLALLTRLGHGTLILPRRLAPWAVELGVEHRAVADDQGAPAALLDGLGAPELLLVDMFPRGVVKELGPLMRRARARWLVTRHVKPDLYLHPPVRAVIDADYERIVWCEEPPPELASLAPRHTRTAPLLLAPPALPRDPARAALGLSPDDARPLLLGIGGGSLDTQRRTAALVAKLASRLAVAWRFVSHELAPGGGVIRLFPLARYLAAADVAVSAAGYHAVHELRAAEVPAVYVPRARRHDDQRRRVAGERIATDPVELERHVEGVLAAARGAVAERPARADAGARDLAGLVEGRVQQRVLGEEQVAALARG